MTKTYCTPLLDETDNSEIGGKAANAARAVRHGLKIPQSIVVKKNTLTDFLNKTGLKTPVRVYLDRLSSLIPAEQKKYYGDLCTDVQAVAMPDTIRAELTHHIGLFLSNASSGLAVRSSGISEDSESASFAGVYESYLGLWTVEEALQRIIRCWCSAWAPAAVRYGQRITGSVAMDAMAVLVQAIIPAEAAGVLFTADPVSGNPWRFELNAVFGLARNLVDGSVPADRFQMDWSTGDVLHEDIADKTGQLVVDRSGIKEEVLDSLVARTPSVSSDTLHDLWEMGRLLDSAFEQRIDIEWAVAAGQIYLIQVRPITALPDFFPMSIDKQDMEKSWKTRLWWGSAECDFRQYIAPFFRDTWESEHWLRYRPDKAYIGAPTYEERDWNGYRYQTEMTNEIDEDLVGLEAWLDAEESGIRAQWLQEKARMKASENLRSDVISSTSTAAALIPHLLAMKSLQDDTQATILGPPQDMGFRCEKLLRHVLNESALDLFADPLLQGLQSYSYERTRSAYDLGRSVDEPDVIAAFGSEPLDNVVPFLWTNHRSCRFLKDLDRIYRTFGYHPPDWLDRSPRWQLWNNRHEILLVIRSVIDGTAQDVLQIFEKNTAVRKKTEADAYRRIGHLGPDVLERFSKILAWAQFWVPVLDDRTWSLVSQYSLFDLIWEAGVRLRKEGVVDKPEETLIFYPEDLESIAHGQTTDVSRQLYLQRTFEYEKNRRLTPPAFIGKPPITDDVSEKETVAAPAIKNEEVHIIEGQGIAPGRTEGLARCVHDLSDPAVLSTFQNHHILVCTGGGIGINTDWLSLLMVVKGLVTSSNAPHLHHAAQIARECGVTYVQVSPNDIGLISDDQAIKIDGHSGMVYI